MRITRAVVVCLGTGFALTACSSGGGSGPTEFSDLKIGDCFNESESIEATTVDVVACSEPHDGEVYLILAPEDLGMDFSEVMVSEWEEYAGTSYDESMAYAYMLIPPEYFDMDMIVPPDESVVVASFNVGGKSTGSIKAG